MIAPNGNLERSLHQATTVRNPIEAAYRRDVRDEMSAEHAGYASGPLWMLHCWKQAGCFGEVDLILLDRLLTRSEKPLESLPEQTMERAEATRLCPAICVLLGKGTAMGRLPSRMRHPG